MPRPEKIEEVKKLKELLKDSKAIYLADFTGLTVSEITELRKRLKEKGYIFKVVKNTLMKIALNEVGKEGITEFLVGPNAIIVTYDDVVEPVKIVYEFQKEFQKASIKTGLLEDKVLKKEEIDALSKLPGLGELRAKVVGSLKSPMAGLVFTLKGVISSLVLTLQTIKKKKEEEV